MADPITALSVVCGAVQLVTTGCSIVKLWQKISQDGSPDPALADSANEVSKIAGDLQEKLPSLKHDCPKERRPITRAAERCLRVSQAVIHELDKGNPDKFGKTPSGTRSGRKCGLALALRAYMNKPKIEKLEKEMERARLDLQTAIISDLW